LDCTAVIIHHKKKAVTMSIQTKMKYLLTIYVVVLAALLVCLAATPLLIQKGIFITQRFLIGEDSLESLLIMILMVTSFFMIKGFKNVLKAYRHMANQAGIEKSRLEGRLSEAFSYIGTVNVEMKEIHSILNSVEHYPKTKKEFKLLMKELTVKLMAFTGAPWMVIRLIDRGCGRTITEHAEIGLQDNLPFPIIGNRAILENRLVDGMRTIHSSQHDLALQTVCILPAMPLSEESVMLTTAILNQIEMFFLLVSLYAADDMYLKDHHTEKANQIN